LLKIYLEIQSISGSNQYAKSYFPVKYYSEFGSSLNSDKINWTRQIYELHNVKELVDT
jgi:hypothetical protein